MGEKTLVREGTDEGMGDARRAVKQENTVKWRDGGGVRLMAERRNGAWLKMNLSIAGEPMEGVTAIWIRQKNGSDVVAAVWRGD